VTLSPEPPGTLTNGEAQPAEGSAPTEPQTPEEVEAIWRNRFSQRDRAHNAEVQSLQEQLAALKTSPPSQPPGGGGNPDDGYKARYEQTQQELQQERQLRAIEARRGKFPALAQEVAADDPLWASAKDETLSRLNATIAVPPPLPSTGPIDPNNPRRDARPATKDPMQMTKDELLRELQRLSPVEEERLRNQM